MAIDINNWIDLSYAVQRLPGVPAFLVNNVFKTKQLHPTEVIAWEEISNTRMISKFKARYGEPNNVSSASYKTKSALTARIFERKVFRAEDLLGVTNSINIVPSGANDVVSAADKKILDELKMLKDRVMSTWEWMCAKALFTGQLTCEGDDVTYTYNYGYEVGKHIVTPTAMWGTQNANIVKDLRTWKKMIFDRTNLNPTLCLLGSEAAEIFVDDEKVKKGLDTLNYRVGALDLNSEIRQSADYLGRFLNIDFYAYSWSASGQEVAPSKMAVLLVPTNDFIMHFGAIYRLNGQNPQLYQVDMLVQTLNDRYNTSIELAIESKPLPIIHNPDLVITSQVVS